MAGETTPRWSPPGLPAPAPLPAIALLVLLSLPILFLGLGRYGVVNADEAFYHDIAWTMLETGDWMRLRTGAGEHVYDTFANAPLQYWVRGLAISWLGPGQLGMRIVSALGAALAVLATYALALRVGGRRAALLAGLVLLTTFQFVYLHSARTGELEPGVCLLLVLAAHTFLRAVEQPARSFWPHHVCIGLLVLWKAPVAPIPVLADLICLALVPAARARILDWLRDGAIVLPGALLWHAYQSWRLWEVLPAVLDAVGDQALRQPGSAGGGLAGRALYYGRVLLFGAFPYVLLAPIALAAAAGRALRRGVPGAPSSTAARVLVAYTVAVLGFYLAISKTGPWYVVHAAPFLAVLVALWIAGLQERGVRAAGLAGLAIALSLLVWLRPAMIGYDPFAESAIRIPMPVGVWRPAGLPAVWGVFGLAAVLALLLFRLRARLAARLGPMLALAVALLFVGHGLLRVLLPLAYLGHLSPVAALAADLAARREAGEPVPLPLEVPPAHPWIVHYYFARDYELRPAARPAAGEPMHRARFVLTARRPRSPAREAPPPRPR